MIDTPNSNIDASTVMDTTLQTELMNSFTWKMRELFNRAIVDTVTYTNKINKLDTSKINLEQQICLMRTPDSVKEKALSKLREIKSKSDDKRNKSTSVSGWPFKNTIWHCSTRTNYGYAAQNKDSIWRGDSILN